MSSLPPVSYYPYSWASMEARMTIVNANPLKLAQQFLSSPNTSNTNQLSFFLPDKEGKDLLSQAKSSGNSQHIDNLYCFAKALITKKAENSPEYALGILKAVVDLTPTKEIAKTWTELALYCKENCSPQVAHSFYQQLNKRTPEEQRAARARRPLGGQAKRRKLTRQLLDYLWYKIDYKAPLGDSSDQQSLHSIWLKYRNCHEHPRDETYNAGKQRVGRTSTDLPRTTCTKIASILRQKRNFTPKIQALATAISSPLCAKSFTVRKINQSLSENKPVVVYQENHEEIWLVSQGKLYICGCNEVRYCPIDEYTLYNAKYFLSNTQGGLKQIFPNLSTLDIQFPNESEPFYEAILGAYNHSLEAEDDSDVEIVEPTAKRMRTASPEEGILEFKAPEVTPEDMTKFAAILAKDLEELGVNSLGSSADSLTFDFRE